MTDENLERIEALFQAAADLPPAERAAWVGKRTGLGATRVRPALYPVVADDRDPVAQARLLQKLWTALEHRGQPDFTGPGGSAPIEQPRRQRKQ